MGHLSGLKSQCVCSFFCQRWTKSTCFGSVNTTNLYKCSTFLTFVYSVMWVSRAMLSFVIWVTRLCYSYFDGLFYCNAIVSLWGWYFLCLITNVESQAMMFWMLIPIILGIVHTKIKISWKCFCFFSSEQIWRNVALISFAHQWIPCSEWVPSEWESKQLIKTSQ